MFLFCLVFAMFCARLFICALWSPAGKGLTSWLSFVVSTVSGILGQVWYLIVSIPDLCTLTYYVRCINCSYNYAAKGIRLLVKKHFCLNRKNVMHVRAFERYIPLSDYQATQAPVGLCQCKDSPEYRCFLK